MDVIVVVSVGIIVMMDILFSQEEALCNPMKHAEMGGTC